MKINLKLYIVILGTTCLFNTIANAQVTTGFNNGVFTDYVGWDAFQNFPLVLQHQGNQQMQFLTDLAAISSVPFNVAPDRLRLDRILTTIGPNNFFCTRVAIPEGGALGFATDWAVNPTPLSALHIGNAWVSNAGLHRLWMDVGTFTTAGSDGMYVGLKESDFTDNTQLWTDHMNSVIAWGDNIANVDNADDMQIIFGANQNAANGDAGLVDALEVMRFTPRGRLGIGNFTPIANGRGSGIKPHRRLEIYDEHSLETNSSTHAHLNDAPQFRLTYTPHATVGLGIHTDFQNTSLGNLIIVTENAGNIANTGIGNFFSVGANVEPKRRLDLFDQGANAPQLRLTHTAAPLLANGIWTDLQTTSAGNLFINPRNNGTNQNVGINTSAPNATLEINSNNTASPGNSGLVLTDLIANTSSIQPTPFTGTRGVLSVDNSGKVILVEDIGGGNVLNSCASTNLMARWTSSGPTLDCSDIFNDFIIKRIGFFTPTPQYAFHNEGVSLFTTTSITSSIPLYSGTGSPLMVNSHDNEGIAILHETPGYGRDMLKIFAESNDYGYGPIPLYHFKAEGSDRLGDVTFDHTIRERADYSWMGYNTIRHMTVMKGDFNIIRDAPTISPALGNLVSGNGSKLYVEAQNPINPATNRMVYGIVGTNSNPRGDYYHAGIFGYIDKDRELDADFGRLANIGGMFYATGATGVNDTRAFNIGMQALAASTGVLSNNYGVLSQAYIDGNDNAGVWCSSSGGLNSNYALYATVATNVCTNGAGNCPQAAGFFDGSVYSTDDYYRTSDATLKTNIQPFSGDSLLRLVPVHTYDFLTQNNFGLALPNGNHYGVLSQEIETILPNMVKTFVQPMQYDTGGNVISQQKSIKAVNYDEFIPLLIAAYQTQANEIDSLKAALGIGTQLRKTNPATINNIVNKLSVELESVQAIVLNQNEPNPFAEQTTITWDIPEQQNGVLNASIMFYDNTGSILKTVKINEVGPGSLLVYGSKLSTGIYTYSLVVNNKTIDSKHMVKTK